MDSMKDEVANILVEQITLEKEIENLKCLLYNHLDFSCFEVFKLFDL